MKCMSCAHLGYTPPKTTIFNRIEIYIFKNGSFSIPRHSMYGIFANIYHKNSANVGKYTLTLSGPGIVMLVKRGAFTNLNADSVLPGPGS